MLPPTTTLLRAASRQQSGVTRSILLRSSTTGTRRTLSQSSSRAAAEHAEHGGHEDHYDPPTGWLFGVKPGEKYKNEGWENVWFYGFFGGLGFLCAGWAFKPDTSIQTWALEEARRRLEVEGILQEPEDGPTKDAGFERASGK